MDTTNKIRGQFAKLVLLLPLIFLSCTHRNQFSENLTDSVVVSDCKIPIDSIRSLNKEYLVKLYGNPFDDDTFQLDLWQPEFRIELYNIFRPDFVKDHEVFINESTWKIDSIYFFTVWYHLDNDNLLPVDSLLWDKYTEF